VTAQESSRRSEQLNALAVQLRAVADTAHAIGEKDLATFAHDAARAFEAKAEARKDYARLNFKVV
jgi:hypothetical protein